MHNLLTIILKTQLGVQVVAENVATEPLVQDGTTTVHVKLSESTSIPVSIVITTVRSSTATEQAEDLELAEAHKMFRDGPELPEGALERQEELERMKENSKKRKRKNKYKQ